LPPPLIVPTPLYCALAPDITNHSQEVLLNSKPTEEH
jgi:hypothetical protein